MAEVNHLQFLILDGKNNIKRDHKGTKYEDWNTDVNISG
jgi:hypothetical protein